MTTTTFKARVLNYDVPAHLTAADLPRNVHPSGFLRKLGARINLSAWVIPETNIPWAYLDELTAVGVEWTLADDLVAIVTANLAKEIKEVGEALARSLAKQTERLKADHEAAETGDAAETVRKKFTTAAKVACQRTARLLKEYEQAAKSFDLDFSTLLGETRQAAAALKTGALVMAHLYAQAAKGLLDQTLAQAAKDGTLPPQILADALQDEGNEAGETLARVLAAQAG